jgi:ubiquinone/menaquinone biosynthesis C-methylase UbiE
MAALQDAQTAVEAVETTTMTPADMYERIFVPAMFAPWARVLLEYAAPRPGELVLDLACGTGIVARHVAPVIGGEGRVVALDLRPGMLAVARTLPAPEGAAIEWRQGDAVALDLPAGSFDLVVCQQGLQFFSDRAAAVREMERVLAPGGRPALNVWQGLERHPVFEAFAEAELRHLAKLGVTRAEVVAPFSLGDAEELRALLEQADLRDIEIVPRSLEVHFPDSERFVEHCEFAYGAVMPQFAEDRAAFRAFVDAVTHETQELVARYRAGDTDTLSFPLHAHIATARKRR